MNDNLYSAVNARVLLGSMPLICKLLYSNKLVYVRFNERFPNIRVLFSDNRCD